jgi:hydroxymethylpyrimidine pyrophosphatase-like HAD family hydrolase
LSSSSCALGGENIPEQLMHYLALATDYDGTVAHDGIVDAETLAALRRLRDSGRKLILVTGRELEDLFTVFDHMDLFDRAVLENGALLYHPATKETRQIAPAPPEPLVDRLRAAGIPLSVGRSILATVVPHEHVVLDAIRDLGVEWHVIFNKGSVMALPSGVNKATGLAPALDELGVPAERVVGVGDAENDHAFLRMCGLSVAVANALPVLKETADVVTAGARGAGVTELIDRMLADDLDGVRRKGG